MDHTTLTSDDRILAARQSLKARMAALEDRVTATVEHATGTVDHATESLRGTIDDATHTVREIVHSTGDNVRGALDMGQRVRANPWASIALAIGAGLATRYLSGKATPRTATGVAPEPRPEPVQDLLAKVREELMTIGQTAIASVSQRLKDKIETLAEANIPSASAPRREFASNGYQRDFNSI